MSWKYEDIVNLPHHVSSRRAPMSMQDRAAQFSPFAALTGYEETIEETARLTDTFRELDSGGVGELDEKLRMLEAEQQNQPQVTVRYFNPDSRKLGGAYVTIRGRVRKIDPSSQTMLLTDGQILYFSRIYGIE